MVEAQSCASSYGKPFVWGSGIKGGIHENDK